MKKKLRIGITPLAFTRNPYLVTEVKRKKLGEIRFNRGTYPLEGKGLIDFFRDLDGAIIGRERIDHSLLKHCPCIRVLSKYGVGLDNIDFKACEDQKVSVLFSQGMNRRSVAEMILVFMISLLRNIYETTAELKKGKWEREGGQQLTGKTIGIIGVGNIGKEVVELLKPFNCTILVNDIIDQDRYYKKNNLTECPKGKIFSKSDIVTIHTPLTRLTLNLVDRSVLKTMKKTAFLINTARGEIVNQEDLKRALKNKTIAGAAIDVYEKEPPQDREFLGLANLICTPHLGGHTREAIEAMGLCAIQNLVGYFEHGCLEK